MSEVRVIEIKKKVWRASFLTSLTLRYWKNVGNLVCPAEFDTGSKGAKNLRAVRQARR